MTCDNCRRHIRPDQVRVKHVGASWGEPAHTDMACVHCCPSTDDIESARDAAFEQRLQEEREA